MEAGRLNNCKKKGSTCCTQVSVAYGQLLAEAWLQEGVGFMVTWLAPLC